MPQTRRLRTLIRLHALRDIYFSFLSKFPNTKIGFFQITLRQDIDLATKIEEVSFCFDNKNFQLLRACIRRVHRIVFGPNVDNYVGGGTT